MIISHIALFLLVSIRGCSGLLSKRAAEATTFVKLGQGVFGTYGCSEQQRDQFRAAIKEVELMLEVACPRLAVLRKYLEKVQKGQAWEFEENVQPVTPIPYLKDSRLASTARTLIKLYGPGKSIIKSEALQRQGINLAKFCSPQLARFKASPHKALKDIELACNDNWLHPLTSRWSLGNYIGYSTDVWEDERVPDSVRVPHSGKLSITRDPNVVFGAQPFHLQTNQGAESSLMGYVISVGLVSLGAIVFNPGRFGEWEKTFQRQGSFQAIRETSYPIASKSMESIETSNLAEFILWGAIQTGYDITDRFDFDDGFPDFMEMNFHPKGLIAGEHPQSTVWNRIYEKIVPNGGENCTKIAASSISSKARVPLKLYKNPGSFVQLIIALYLDKYDWSTGVNRPMSSAFQSPKEIENGIEPGDLQTMDGTELLRNNGPTSNQGPSNQDPSEQDGDEDPQSQ